MIDLLVSGGHVVTPYQEGLLDIGVSGEHDRVRRSARHRRGRGRPCPRRRRASSSSRAASSRTPTSTSRCTRAGQQGRDVWLQPPEGATRAALHGGTTTVVSFAFMDVHVDAAGVRRERRRRASPPDLRLALVRRLRLPPGLHGHPVRRDDGLDRRRGRRRHRDVQVLHHRPHDDADRDPARQRLGTDAARGVRAPRGDGDGARRGRRPDQVHGGQAQARGANRARQRPPRPHEPRRGARRPDGGGARAGRGRGRVLRPRLRRAGARHDRGLPRGRPAGLRRGAAQLHVLLARRLRQAGRREVPHRYGPPAPRGRRGALARARGRSSVDACDGRVHDVVRGEDGRHGPRDDARAATSASRRAVSSATPRGLSAVGSRCSGSWRSSQRTPRGSPACTRARA